MEKILEINGEVIQPLSLSLDDVRHRYPSYTVQTSFLNGVRRLITTFAGARLWDVIGSAQLNVDPISTLCVMARARDGLHCVIRWHEVDPTLTNRIILVAYEQDKQRLTPVDGPLRLVVPGDVRGRRYLRGLVQLTVFAQTEEDESLSLDYLV